MIVHNGVKLNRLQLAFCCTTLGCRMMNKSTSIQLIMDSHICSKARQILFKMYSYSLKLIKQR